MFEMHPCIGGVPDSGSDPAYEGMTFSLSHKRSRHNPVWNGSMTDTNFQSAYRKNHSTETAMQRVLSDILMAADERLVARLSTVGGRAFNVAGPRVWNLLPEEITSAQSLSMFRQRLKTFLFEKSYPDVIL